MKSPWYLSFLLAFCFVAACGGDDNGGLLSQATNATTVPAVPRGPQQAASLAPGSVDVCKLFNAEDARAVVMATKPPSDVDIRFSAEPLAVREPTLGACKFRWNGVPAGSIAIWAMPGTAMSAHRTLGKPIPNLGDEALTELGTAYLRVGNVMLSVGENSFPLEFVIEMYKRIAPKMK
jgi:hypothetical protein